LQVDGKKTALSAEYRNCDWQVDVPAGLGVLQSMGLMLLLNPFSSSSTKLLSPHEFLD
jgi:hypothetical protein